jgi:DNA-binding Xre family transcriptional regulator
MAIIINIDVMLAYANERNGVSERIGITMATSPY